MNLLATAKGEVPIISMANDMGTTVKTVSANKSLTLTGITKNGIDTYYTVKGGGYINGKNVVIKRDVDYFYSNFKSKNLMTSNFTMNGGNGLTSLLGTNLMSIQPGSMDSGQVTNKGELISIASDSKESGGITGRRTSNSSSTFGIGKFLPQDIGIFTGKKQGGNGFGLGGFPISSDGPGTGGFFGNMGTMDSNKGTSNGSTGTATTSKNDYMSNVNRLGVSSILKTDNSAFNGLFKGVSIGNLFDGSIGKLLLGNLSDLLSSWISDKLNYVVGYDFASSLSNMYNTFGETFDSLLPYGAGGAGSLIGGQIDSGDGRIDMDPYVPTFPTIIYFDTGGSLITDQMESETLTYAEIDQAMIDYFEYKGCNGEKITRTFGTICQWEQDAYYSTPELDIPTQSAEEAQFFRDMYEADYSDFKDGITAIREEFDIDIDRQTIFTKFNRFRFPTPDNELTGSRGHIFFTRPDMNLILAKGGSDVLSDDGSAGIGSSHASPLMFNMLKSHGVLMSYLMGSNANGSDSFVPILSDRCTGLDISDEVLETGEAGETLTGWKTIYGLSTIKSKTAGTVNVNFTDDDMLSVYKIMKVWTEYISAVYRGEAEPIDGYADKHILDYAISIYYFLTKSTGEDILFWSKFTGCFPTNCPSSNFSDSLGNQIRRPNYTVSFSFARKDDYNPLSIAEFNKLSYTDYEYMPVYNEDTLHVNKSFLGAPFVDTGDGGHLFKLKFRPE